jgi:acyl-CoA hydrolase
VPTSNPIEVDDVALVGADVCRAGHTGARVRLRAFRENPRTGETEPTTEFDAVYVAIDADREPTPVPELTVPDEEGERLRREALAGEDD